MGEFIKEAFTNKFSDDQSGIHSSTLNGRKIQSGSKITTPGAYQIEVADRAGHCATVKFRIRN